MAVALSVTAVPSASAQPGDTSNASARFLSGTLLSSGTALDDLALLNGVSATNSGSPTAVVQHDPLDLTALSLLTVDMPSGVSIPLGDFLQLGAVNQYAEADDNGVSRSASGAVSDSGAVDTTSASSFPSDATLDLTKLLGTSSVLDVANLHVGAISGVAARTGTDQVSEDCSDLSNPVNCRDYNIASAALNLHSDVIGDLVSSINDTLDSASATVNGLSDTLLGTVTGVVNDVVGLLGGASDLDVTINADLKAALSSVLSDPIGVGGVSLDLSTGTIHVDLETVLGGLHQPPNTPLLSGAVLTSIAGDLASILTDLQDTINNVLSTALDAVTVKISGGICEPLLGCDAPLGGKLSLSYNGTLQDLASGSAVISATGTGIVFGLLAPLVNLLTTTLSSTLAGVVQPLLTTVLSTVGDAVSSAVSDLSDDLDPALSAIGDVVGATLNVQEPGATTGSLREVALRVSLLGGNAATVDLGRAEVGPNSLVATPTATSLDPDHGPAAGGTTVTITGSNFIDGVTSVDFGGTVIDPADVTVIDDTTLTVESPPSTPGPVDVTVSNGAGATSAPPLTYTYEPVDAPTITKPHNGDTVLNGTPDIDGTGTPGYTVDVTDDGDPVCTATVDAAGMWSCTPETPLDPGDHTITATQTDPADNTSPKSDDVTFTVADVPAAPVLSAEAGDGYVTLSWTKPDDGGVAIDGYNLYMGTSAGGESPTPVNGSTLIPGLGYQVPNLTNGTTYYFIVKAVNEVGASVASNEASATPSADVCVAPFDDVPSTNPFCADISWLKANGITNGVGNNLYAPKIDVTRDMMAGFVYRQLNETNDDLTCTSKPFPDVHVDNVFCGDIAWLKTHGVLKGYDNGTFKPAHSISRGEISAYLYRMNNLGDADPTCTEQPFSDVAVDNVFCGDITWGRDHGILNGNLDGTFDLSASTLRQVMAAVLHRMDQRLK